MLRKIALIFFLAAICAASKAETQQDNTLHVSNDSNSIIKTSILCVSPGSEVYSCAGHAAIRMEFPEKGMDYCFTFETDPDGTGIVTFFAGKAHAKVVAVETLYYLEGYKRQGRGITQYPLNLTLNEKRELWRKLDDTMLEGDSRTFNLLQNQCTSILLYAIESILEDEYIEFRNLPQQVKDNNGDGVRYISRLSPWATFAFTTFIGASSDKLWDAECRISPQDFDSILPASIIKARSGNERPLLSGKVETLLRTEKVITPTPFTPLLVFAVLLLIVVIATIIEKTTSKKGLMRWFDRSLLIIQTTVGIFLLFTMTVSCLFGTEWNWLAIPFNPLPAIIWFAAHKRKNFHVVYRLYAVILALFIIITPCITTQIETSHLLIVGVLLIRCIANIRRKAA